MELVGNKVSPPVLLLVGGLAGAGERLVELQLLEKLCFGAAAICCGAGGVLVEDGGDGDHGFAKAAGGSGRRSGGMALSPDPALKKIGVLPRPMFLFDLYPAFGFWWLLRLENASRQGISSAPKRTLLADALLSGDGRGFVRLVAVEKMRPLKDLFVFSWFVRGFCVIGGWQLIRLYPSRISVLVRVSVILTTV
jgi:hypothetical protein